MRTAFPQTLRSAQFQQTLSPSHSRTCGYCHMESLPGGMVASALQSRIHYLTKQAGNLPVLKGRTREGTRATREGSSISALARCELPLKKACREWSKEAAGSKPGGPRRNASTRSSVLARTPRPAVSRHRTLPNLAPVADCWAAVSWCHSGTRANHPAQC